MIPSGVLLPGSANVLFDAQGTRLADGSVVQVEVLAKSAGKNASGAVALIRVAGRVIEVSDAAGFSPGDVFTARVQAGTGALILKPVSDSGFGPGGESVCVRLGIPETPANVQVVSLMTLAGVALDPAVVVSVVRAAENAAACRVFLKTRRAGEDAIRSFSHSRSRNGKLDKNLLFASWLLQDASVEADPELLEKVVRGLEGGTEFSSLFAYLNHSRGADKHWIVVPFERGTGDSAIRGSVRILVDLVNTCTVRTEVWCEADNRVWEFYFTGSEYSFSSVPEFSSVTFERLRVYLEKLLSSFGVENVFCYRPEAQVSAGSVDIQR